MSHSPLHRALARIAAIADYCDTNKISTEEGLERIAHEEERARARRLARREFLATTGRAAAAGAALAFTPGLLRAGTRSTLDVAIVGAGMAGLACAVELKRAGVDATLYDASNRVGGRVYSLPGTFPGQVAERGGEFIDNLHKTMLGYAKAFGLTLEDVEKLPGEVFYYFGGTRYPEARVVTEYRAFVDALRADLRAISGTITAESHTTFDAALDRVSLAEYLDGRNGAGIVAGPVIREAIVQAYIAEYGRAAEEQSCLNFLLFIHADRRSKFKPFGVFSDERYHVIEGNDRIPAGLAALVPGQIEGDLRLVAVRKTSGGSIELTLKDGPRTVTRRHDAVVLAIPFTVLRSVELDASLAIPASQRAAIANLGYGDNAKMMIGFSGRPWIGLGSNGSSYADLPNCQTTWETNPANASSAHAVLTDYSGAARGLRLDPARTQAEAGRFLTDLDLVYPGALTTATKIGRDYVAHLEHWPSNPLTLGSYTCYLPGQFTTVCGLEGKPVGNLFFAGEHANSFYEWQGFMEGAALSGIAAASGLLALTGRSGAKIG